ncbi:MAG TPA: MBL fold metallo-hydrolase [Bryobacteraceae bacterium]|nr:MBL fold metallo-hydrolase [Bryobacteraceae bacterium]
MNRRLIARLCAGLLFVLLAWVAYTQNQGKPPALTINKVHDDLYEIVGDGGNVAVLVTSEGIILVDDKFEQDHDAILARIRTISQQPVKYIINTHYHQDHSGGNAKFLPTADIISTQNARTNIIEHKQSNVTGSAVAPARIVFTDETAVFLGGREVRAKYFGRGHTNGDAVVYFPQLKTIHTGDLMAGTSPLIDYNGGGSLLEWTKTLDGVMKLDFDTVIPGHGDLTNKAGLKTYRDNVAKLQTRVRGLIRAGKTQDEVAKVMTDEYKWAPNSLQQQWSVPGMMKEMK